MALWGEGQILLHETPYQAQERYHPCIQFPTTHFWPDQLLEGLLHTDYKAHLCMEEFSVTLLLRES